MNNGKFLLLISQLPMFYQTMYQRVIDKFLKMLTKIIILSDWVTFLNCFYPNGASVFFVLLLFLHYFLYFLMPFFLLLYCFSYSLLDWSFILVIIHFKFKFIIKFTQKWIPTRLHNCLNLNRLLLRAFQLSVAPDLFGGFLVDLRFRKIFSFLV